MTGGWLAAVSARLDCYRACACAALGQPALVIRRGKCSRARTMLRARPRHSSWSWRKSAAGWCGPNHTVAPAARLDELAGAGCPPLPAGPTPAPRQRSAALCRAGRAPARPVPVHAQLRRRRRCHPRPGYPRAGSAALLAVVAEDWGEPLLRLRQGHPLAAGIVLDLVAVDLPDGKVAGLRVSQVPATHGSGGIHR